REKQKESWKEQMEEWLSSGYLAPSYPDILQKDFNELEKWFTKLSSNIAKIKENLEWLMSIDEIEVQEQKDLLIEAMKEAEDMGKIDSKIADFKIGLSGIEEKRNEIKRWAKLWKDEGYNTEKIEEGMGADLTTAWNIMTQFMDDIQNLKEAKEEVEGIKQSEGSESFMGDIRDIEFLLNDTGELENIGKLLTDLKDTIETENTEKASIMENAQKIKEMNFDVSHVLGSTGLRAKVLRERMELIDNNARRILNIRSNLEEFDKRDLKDEIESFATATTDPLNIDEYEDGFLKIKDKVDKLSQKREEIRREVEDWRSQGYNIGEIESKIDLPVEQLETFRGGFISKLSELTGLKENLSKMDHRWLEEEFNAVEGMLLDPSNINFIKDKMKELYERIETRESKRAMVRTDMEGWSKEGFTIDKLSAVLEDDDTVFMHIHDEMGENISRTRELIKRLDSLDTTFFKEKAAGSRARMMDPFNIESSKGLLDTLSQAIDLDRKQRDGFISEIEELDKQGWHTKGILETTTDTPPEYLQQELENARNKIDRLKTAQQEINDWNALESKWLDENIESVREHLTKIMEFDDAIKEFEDLRTQVEINKQKRETIRNKLAEWKDIGYITKKVEKLLDSNIESLLGEFDSIKGSIEELEKLQATFDSLSIEHFKAEAEEIEFKLNDPELVEEIRININELEKNIQEDRSRRDHFRQRIDDYLKEGFMNAENLRNFLDEEISIVELEFNNFRKEVDLFKNYMEKVGFSFKGTDSMEANEKVVKDKLFMKLIPFNEGWTFDTFVVGSCNGIAHKAAIEVANNPGRDYNPLFIISHLGLGKTHLLHAIGNSIKGNNQNRNVAYVSIEKFTNDLEKAMDMDRIEEFRDHYRSQDVLLIDDIPFISGKEETQEELFNTFNTLFESGKQIVMTSDRHPKDIPKLANRLRSRFEGGVIVEIEPLDGDTKTKLIENEAEQIHLKIPENLMENMSSIIKGNVRDLKSILKSIGMKYKTEGKALDEELIKNIISERNDDKEGQKIDKALGDM
ncbi:MAG: DnaA/Hda family protein, partial [Candidatus Thermoplasmatota archaeon]|nr:DnaA/Hda family protein [Candidatus Thermoplasmatota archaeon]